MFQNAQRFIPPSVTAKCKKTETADNLLLLEKKYKMTSQRTKQHIWFFADTQKTDPKKTKRAIFLPTLALKIVSCGL